MTIQAISSVKFSGVKKTEKGNEYKSTKAATTAGAAAGLALATGLMLHQTRALKTIKGKRNLLEGLHEKGISLEDFMVKKPIRDKDGKIVPPEKGVSARSKKVVGEFKKTVALWGAGIMAAATGIGKAVDSHFNSENAKAADAKAAKK